MEIFKLFGSILIDNSEANKSISKTAEETEGLGTKLKNGIGTAAKWAAGVVAGATAVGGAMVAAAKSTASELDVIDKASQRMGVTAEGYQELAYAAGLCGVEMSVLEDATKDLQKSGSELSFEEALAQIQSITDESERSAKAYELFGEKAYQLTPLINAGADSMAAMKTEAHDLGLVMSNEAVASGASMNDMFSKVEASISTLKNGLVSELMPYVMEILQWVIDNIPMIKETVQTVMDTIIPIVKPIIEKVMAFLPPIMNAIKKLLDWLTPYLEPILNGVFSMVDALFDLLSGDTEGFVEGMKTALINLGTALYSIGKDIVTALWNGIKEVWNKVAGWVEDKVNWVKDKFATVKNFLTNNGQGSSVDIQGHHAAGLNYVPYDGYVAELHKGETVLNAGSSASMVNEIINGIKDKVGGNSGPIELTLNIDGRAFAHATYGAMQYEASRVGGSLVV